MTSGLIFDVQRFSLHDGPGLRTTVFFKGCPLRCLWCHNPESRSAEPEIRIEPGRCIGCGACRDRCPAGFATLPIDETTEERAGAPAADAGCTLCGTCVDLCPTEARRMAGRSVTVEEVLAEVSRDRVFFEESGGGVTFSGGEPLSQPEFLVACLEACRGGGLHTAVDTSGHGSGKWLARAAGHADLFLFDVKVLDEERHRRLTGAGNAGILENLGALNDLGAEIWLRVPVIPGFNDDEVNLESIRRLAASLGSVRKVCLLPFHRHGLHKRRDPGEQVSESLADLAPPSRDRLEALAGPFRAAGLQTSIGG